MSEEDVIEIRDTITKKQEPSEDNSRSSFRISTIDNYIVEKEEQSWRKILKMYRKYSIPYIFIFYYVYRR